MCHWKGPLKSARLTSWRERKKCLDGIAKHWFHFGKIFSNFSLTSLTEIKQDLRHYQICSTVCLYHIATTASLACDNFLSIIGRPLVSEDGIAKFKRYIQCIWMACTHACKKIKIIHSINCTRICFVFVLCRLILTCILCLGFHVFFCQVLD